MVKYTNKDGDLKETSQKNWDAAFKYVPGNSLVEGESKPEPKKKGAKNAEGGEA